MQPNSHPTPAFLLRLQRAGLHWRVGAWTFASAFACVVALALLLPDTYRSRMQVVVGTVSPALHESPVAALDLNDADPPIARLFSDEILRQIVLKEHLAPADGSHSAKSQEIALRKLQDDLTIASFQGPDLVELTYQATTPQRAAGVLRDLAATYAGTHRIVPARSASASRLQTIARKTHAHLVAARAERAQRAHMSPNPPDPAASQADARRTLNRRIADLQSLDTALHNRLGEARLIERLDAQSLSAVGTLEPSDTRILHAPPRGLILSLGSIASLLLALGTMFTLDAFSNRLGTKSSVEEAIGVPVLASLPANAVAPAFENAFPALYLAMQRPHTAYAGKLS